MLQVFVLKGIPASGKSTWAKAKVAEDPLHWTRINNDDIRSMYNGSEYSPDYEKIISSTRLWMIREALKRDHNLIVDNVNASQQHFKDVCQIAGSLNKNIEVVEKPFYLDLQEAVDRDLLRTESSQVGENVIKYFWKQLGGDKFKDYQPQKEIFKQKNTNNFQKWVPLPQNSELPRAVIFDNDGTVSLIGKRSPYDASRCDEVDSLHPHVAECLRLYYRAGYKVIFVSGREEKDRIPTERFYQKYIPDITEYLLYMRPTGNKEKDVIIKERIFNEHIKDKYYIAGWYDDRLQICSWLYKAGFPLFRVGDPEASF